MKPVVIGRSEDADYPIAHDALSRRHCRFFFDGDAVWVEDLDSSNGTTLNGARLEPGERTRVPPDSKVALADEIVLDPEFIQSLRPNRPPAHAASSGSGRSGLSDNLPAIGSGNLGRWVRQLRGGVVAAAALVAVCLWVGIAYYVVRPEQSSDANRGTASRSAPESQESSPKSSSGGGGVADTPAETSPSLSAEQIYRRAEGSLMLVKAQGLEASSVGSGFALGAGAVVTNEHVVADASKITVEPTATRAARSREARLVAEHPVADLALLRSEIDTEGLPLGKFAAVSVGQTVFVASNPKGLEATFSEGIVSSIRSEDGSTILQITAPVSEGSSGGPVLNEAGKVIGVVFAVARGGQNLNFAVPVSYVRELQVREY
jgi:serine protease Do